MKKRILGMVLCVCMVLSLLTVAAFADESYLVTQNFKYGTRTYDGGDAHESPYEITILAGETCTLATIEDCSPYKLVGWQESGTETIYPPYAEIKVNSARTFDAVYQVQGGLTITVDGFMPGNTPDDCTVTFESTIPGVTFSETDIRGFSFVGSEEPMGSTDVFEAGTRYKLDIALDNKGLELTPSTTVNGIAPTFCRIAYNNNVPYAIAIVCDLGTPVAPTLAVTVDNYEVGKTPNDITYSFASTNLDVTFDESDILGVAWEAYDRFDDSFCPVDSVDEFQDRVPSYRCTIELDSKGLTEAPAVTVNGKTPESCEIVTSGGKKVLRITCKLGAPLARQLTIFGTTLVCKDQDYEFSVTAAEGAEVLYSVYRFGEYGSDLPWSRVEDGVYYGTVPASEYGDANSIELTVYGTAASGKPVTATKTVQISKEHRFVDGVCGCGAVEQYTITYHPGRYGTGSIPAGTKTHGEPFTLSSETFKRDGYVQTGWQNISGTREYDLGATYTEDQAIMLWPVWEKLVTVTADFTTTVALGDAGEPGETTFGLALVDCWGDALAGGNVTAAAAVTTDGAGDYDGALTITGPERTLWRLLSEGAFAYQVDDGEAGWTVDDTVWGLLMSQAAALSDDAAAGYTLLVVPASVDEFGNYDIDWNAIDWEDPQSADMTFTNTYTAHVYELNHDADGHWDECAGCGDKQNAEPHQYGDWKVTKEATEKEAGEKEHTCTVCGYTEKAEIAKLPAMTDPTNPDTKPETKPETKPATGTVQTGDDGFVLWAALFVTSGTLLAVTGVHDKRRRSARAK